MDSLEPVRSDAGGARTDVAGNVEVEDRLSRIAEHFRGAVVSPDHPEYERSRKVWNAMYDDRRPAAILRCADADDVSHALRCLSGTTLPIAVRGGGHHIAGFGGCDAGFVIDLSAMRRVEPTADGNRMLVQGGATLHDVDVVGDRIGRGVPLGVVSPTGVGGLALSGGVGWLTRRHGYTCDNILSAEVVIPSGEIVHATDAENPDLLWGLKGGGGNFGVVTTFEFASHPVREVHVAEAYHLVRDEEHLGDILRFYRDWTAELPRDVTAWIAVEHASAYHELLPSEATGALVASLAACCIGRSSRRTEELLRPVGREQSPAATRDSTMTLVELQHSQDDSGAAALGMRSYMKGEMIADLTDEAIAGIAKYGVALPTRDSLFEMGMVGGAMQDWDEMDAAVGLRDAAYLAGFSMMSGDDQDDISGGIEWARAGWSTLLAGSAGGVYLNFSGDESEERVYSSLSAHSVLKRERIREIKGRYDPGNTLRNNHNIRPLVKESARSEFLHQQSS
jgi:FAD/FMN-containing dehydrogenase